MSDDKASNDSRRVEVDLAELDKALQSVKDAINTIMVLSDTIDKQKDKDDE